MPVCLCVYASACTFQYGLSPLYHIVSLQGRDGIGSVFWFTLPMIAGDVTTTASMLTMEGLSTGHRHSVTSLSTMKAKASSRLSHNSGDTINGGQSASVIAPVNKGASKGRRGSLSKVSPQLVPDSMFGAGMSGPSGSVDASAMSFSALDRSTVALPLKGSSPRQLQVPCSSVGVTLADSNPVPRGKSKPAFIHSNSDVGMGDMLTVKRHIVFVDDEEPNRRIGKRMLSKLDCMVTILSDGEDIINLLRGTGQLPCDNPGE